MDPPPTTAMQVAFTAAGLQAFGVPDDVVGRFFPGISHRDGGGEPGAPAGRRRKPMLPRSGTGALSQAPHLVVMFFGEPDRLETSCKARKGDGVERSVREMRGSETSDLDGVEPFGFADGISQPQIDWERQRDTTQPQLDYTNIVALGEFLLGYPNEYDKYTDRPLLDSDAASRGLPRRKMPRTRKISVATAPIW